MAQEAGSTDSQVLKGVLDTVVLYALARADNYGFGLLQDIREHFEDGDTVLKEQTIYPLLHRLEARGFLDSYHRPGKRGTPRKFYRITDAGRVRLSQRTAQWRRVTALLERTVFQAEPEPA